MRVACTFALLLSLGSPAAFTQTRLSSCSALPPDSIERGACHRKLQQWKEAEHVYRALVNARPNSIPAVLGLVETLFRLDHAVEASQHLRKLVRDHPNEPAVLKVQAWMQAQVEKAPRGAEQTLLKLTRLAPTDADSWSLLASFYLDTQRAEDGIRCFRQAVKLEPRNALYQAGLARAYAAAGREAEAESGFAAALALPGAASDPSVQAWHADFLASRQHHEESTAAFSRAIALDPADGAVRLRKASAELKAGRFRVAESDALEAQKLGASEREVQTLLVRVYQGLGDEAKLQAAAEAVERAADAEENRRSRWRRARVALEKAESLMEAGRCSDALPLYVAVTSDVPDYADAWFAAGVCHIQANNAGSAEEAFRNFLRLQPLSAEGHSALGMVLLAQQRYAEARTALQEALRLDPSSTEAKEALEFLKAQGK